MPSDLGESSFVTDLLDSLERSGGDPTVMIVDTCAGNADDDVAPVIARAAIPRRFDAHVLGVLADDADKGAYLLGAVGSLPFVQPHPAGGWRYHDRTRDALLRRWRAESQVAEFRRLSTSLARDQEKSLREATSQLHEVAIAADTLAAANPLRLRAIRRAVEDREMISFREAAYHWRNVGAADLIALLERVSGLVDANPRLADPALAQIRRALREPGSGSDISDTGAQGRTSPFQRLQLRYWELRLTPWDASLDLAPAWTALCDDLGQMPGDGDGDVERLQRWARGALTGYLLDVGRSKEAAESSDRELELVDRDKTSDEWHLANVLWRRARAQSRLGDQAGAAAALQSAAVAAAKSGNVRSEIRAHLEQVGPLVALGDHSGARRAAAGALHVCWTAPASLAARGATTIDVLDLVRDTLQCFGNYVANDDVRLTDSVVAQAEALVPTAAREASDVQLRLGQALALFQHGALDRASQIIDDLVPLIATVEDPVLRGQLQDLHVLERGAILDAQGLPTQSEQCLAAHLAAGCASADAKAAAWFNRAENLADLRRWDDAEHAATTARDLLLAAHDALYAGGAEALRARVILTRGDTDRGLAVWDRVDAQQIEDESEINDAVQSAKAAAAVARGRWDLAGAGHERRAVVAAQRGNLITAARAYAAAAQAYLRCGQWSRAAAATAELSAVNTRLERGLAAPSTDLARQADDALAKATQRFFDGAADRRDDLGHARAELQAARRADPDNTWIAVAQYYVARELDEWDEAGVALAMLAKRRPAWLSAEWITDRKAEFEHDHGPLPSGPVATIRALGAAARSISRLFGRDR